NLLAAALAATLCCAVSGCNNETSESVPESGSTVSAPESKPESTVESSGSSSETNSSNTNEDISANTPDDDNALTKYMRYARPFFKTTLDVQFDFDAFDGYEDYEVYQALGEFLREGSEQFSALDAEKDCFEVKTGDRLENGLLVTVEPTERSEEYTFIKLDGEFTMEGVLYLEKEDHDYIYRARDLTFYPDGTKNSFIPASGAEIMSVVFPGTHSIEGVAFDGYPYFLGNIDDAGIDEREIFGDKELVRVRLTVDNITIGPVESIYDDLHADIVDIERID
ncbi:MAG: hypothetical protein NC401_20105, partial [Ruminococcus sp.]|nr:hypothetical protein [Ruminococcus sp.]